MHACRNDTTFQVLTRHPQRLELFLAWLDRPCGWLPMRPCEASLCKAALEEHGIDASRFATAAQTTWPLSNVWLGLRASAPDLSAKLPRLIHASATLRWLYVDRQATHLDLTRLEGRRDELSGDGKPLLSGNGVRMSLNALSGCIRHSGGAMVTTVGRLGWVVADARQNAALARCLAEQCARAKVPIYCFGDRQGLLPRQMPKRLEQAPPVDRRTAAAHPAVTAAQPSAGRWLSSPAAA